MRLHRLNRSDRGASVPEAAILLPLLMIKTLAIVQAGLWFHARAIATTAANQSVDAARVEGGTAADGRMAGEQFIRRSGVLRDPEVQVSRSTEVATATVSGQVVSLMFGAPFSVSVEVDAPVERVLP
jgi:Flp pilus assembly protein TadG